MTAVSHLVVFATTCGLPPPGDPQGLVDWRWLARPPRGERHVTSDPAGRRKLPKADGGYLLADVPGPGVLDHLWLAATGKATVTIAVDGGVLGRVSAAEGLRSGPQDRAIGPFPRPVAFGGGGMLHVLAPVGFQRRLRVTSDKATPHYVSYRTFASGTAVVSASGKGKYIDGLKRAAEAWRREGYDFRAPTDKGERMVVGRFELPCGARATALDVSGSGEVVGLEFHVHPALTGSLRDVVVEISYDGADSPALRLPLPDLAGVPHPWSVSRWDRYNGDLAAGLRYPWTERTPRVYHGEATFDLNLPLPFADGLQVQLVNRSPEHHFTGFVRAAVVPLSKARAVEAGRLCGTRRLIPLAAAETPQPMLDLPGPGQIVGLGLFMTGNRFQSPAARNGVVALRIDGREPITGAAVVPLWFQGAYGGPVMDRPSWNHPRMEENFVGAMRHFLTDPIPFARSAVLGYTPGADATGAPTKATAVALWYRFGEDPYAAPRLPERAEPLPQSTYGFKNVRLGPDGKEARLVWAAEAEDLVPMAVAAGCLLDVADDTDHNYHPSGGKYLRAVADGIGAHVDCAVRLPHYRYVAVGTHSLWGPARGTFEIDLLTVREASRPPELVQTGMAGRQLWNPPIRARILMAGHLAHARDPWPHHPAPMRNPAPDGKGVLRFICAASSNEAPQLLALDQVRLDAPPPTEAGWHEFEEQPLPGARDGLKAWLPKYGSFTWSGWGALRLKGPAGGRAVFRATVAAGPTQPTALVIRGSLGPGKGVWQVHVPGHSVPVTLKPGKDGTQAVQWTVPLRNMTLPGAVVLDVACIAPAKKTARQRTVPDGELALDAWTVEQGSP